MKKLLVVVLVSFTLLTGGCATFLKDRDIELYLVGATLSYIVAKHACRKSEHDEKCGIGAATAFVLWY